MSRGKCIVYIHTFANIATYRYNGSMEKPATIETTQEAPKTVTNSPQNPPIMENNKGLATKSPASITSDDRQLAYIRNKRAFTAFKRLVQKGKYISARTTAQALGVSPQTIINWSSQNSIIEAMTAETDTLVEGLKHTNSPQGFIYLLEKIAPTDKQASNNVAIQIVLPSLQDTQGQILAL